MDGKVRSAASINGSSRRDNLLALKFSRRLFAPSQSLFAPSFASAQTYEGSDAVLPGTSSQRSLRRAWVS
jgi:hypothetical protein